MSAAIPFACWREGEGGAPSGNFVFIGASSVVHIKIFNDAGLTFRLGIPMFYKTHGHKGQSRKDDSIGKQYPVGNIPQ